MVIRILDDEERRNIYQGYLQQDFHQSEIKPYSLMEKLVKEQRYLCHGLFDQEELQGYAFFVEDWERRILLLDYFAVLSDYRSGGLGGRFIQAIQTTMSRDNLTLLAEVENPAYATDEQSRNLMNRRIQFYRRNGFTISQVWSRVFTDEYIIIYYNGPDQSEEENLMEENLKDELNHLYQTIFGEKNVLNHIYVRSQND